MTDRQTTTETTTDTTTQTATDPNAAPTADPGQPTGTRELRDAQTGRAATTRADDAVGTAASRPPIRAATDPASTGAATSAAAAPQSGATSGTPAAGEAPLFDEDAGQGLRERWIVIQTEFVDEPKAAVQKADGLVAEVLQQLTDTFARERESLEAGWSRDDGSNAELSTEDLRQAIQRYRSFFNRLLSF